MALTKQSAAGSVIGTLGLVTMLTNPNREFKDFKEPQSICHKWESNAGYNNSGRVYVLGSTVFLAAAIGLGYTALTVGIRKREEK